MTIQNRPSLSAASAAALQTLAERGYVILRGALAPALILHLRTCLDQAEIVCREIQRRNGIHENMSGTTHHLPAIAPDFLDVLECGELIDLVRAHTGSNIILNSYGGVMGRPETVSYVHQIHRDVRQFLKESRVMVNALVMLDDFTPENGATYLMPGSHLQPERPAEEAFYAAAERATGAAGDILVFDSRLWHAAGRNSTGLLRRALTLTFTPPYFKQQFDYCSAVAPEHMATESRKQLLGFFSRVPGTLSDWYQPPERRFYRSDQV